MNPSWLSLIYNLRNILLKPLKWLWSKIQKLLCRSTFKENEELKLKLTEIKDMVYDKDKQVYWHKDDINKQIPYCPKCWSKSRIKMHMVPWSNEYKCIDCNFITRSNIEYSINDDNNSNFINWF